MSLIPNSIRLLRLLPVISSTATLQFAVDEQLIFGTWMQPALHEHTNTTLPTWWTQGGLRWRWVIILGYPINYILGILNLLIARDELYAASATKWYVLGLTLSIAHMYFVKTALHCIGCIEKGVPKDNVVQSMGAWLRMNWIRGWITDFPAWLCFIVGALKVL
jgi:hypothetical protein